MEISWEWLCMHKQLIPCCFCLLSRSLGTTIFMFHESNLVLRFIHSYNTKPRLGFPRFMLTSQPTHFYKHIYIPVNMTSLLHKHPMKLYNVIELAQERFCNFQVFVWPPRLPRKISKSKRLSFFIFFSFCRRASSILHESLKRTAGSLHPFLKVQQSTSDNTF